MNLKKILVVDDERDIVKLLEIRFKNEGYQVVTASDGVEAMELVAKHKPDFIVLDVMMPQMNGYNVCNHLKFDPNYKDIPILLLTARDQEIDKRISNAMGVYYMHKPYNNDELIKLVNQVVGK